MSEGVTHKLENDLSQLFRMGGQSSSQRSLKETVLSSLSSTVGKWC